MEFHLVGLQSHFRFSMEELLGFSCFPTHTKVIGSALGRGCWMELLFKMCSSSKAAAQGQMHGKPAVSFGIGGVETGENGGSDIAGFPACTCSYSQS